MGSKAWRLANREKFLAQQRRSNARNADYRWAWQLKNRYGITPDDYADMLGRQGGCCAICGSDQPGGRGKRFHVDHDHESGQVRGLLCWSCNTRLGHVEDNRWLERATAYLAQYKVHLD